MSEVTHSFELPTKIGDCCDTESTRYALSYVEAIPGESGTAHLSATNTRVLAIVHVAAVCPSRIMIPAAVLPKKRTKKITPKVEANGNWQNSDGKYLPIPDPEDIGRFPKCESILPDLKDGREFLRLRIDARLLSQLASAITNNESNSAVTLFVPVPSDEERKRQQKLNCDSEYVVDSIPCLGNAGIGVIMPMTAEKIEDADYCVRRSAYIAAREAVKE